MGKHDALLNKLGEYTADEVDTLVKETAAKMVDEGLVVRDSQVSLTGLLWAAIIEKGEQRMQDIDRQLEGHGTRRGG